MLQEQNYRGKTVKGSKVIIAFVLLASVTAFAFAYGIYDSYMTRPKIKIEEEKK